MLNEIVVFWVSIKWPCSIYDIKGEVVLNKREFMKSRSFIEILLAWDPQNKNFNS